MPRKQAHERRLHLETLETRLQLRETVPANSIATAEGTVPNPAGIDAATVVIAARNLTAGKSSTLFGIFVEPASSSNWHPGSSA